MAFAYKNDLINLLQLTENPLLLFNQDRIEVLEELENEIRVNLVIVIVIAILKFGVPFPENEDFMEDIHEFVEQKISDYHPVDTNRQLPKNFLDFLNPKGVILIVIPFMVEVLFNI